MENEKTFSDKKKIMPIIIAAVVILALIVVVALLSNKKMSQPTGDTPSGQTEQPVDETGMTEGENEMGEGAETEETNPVLVDAERVTPGTNLVSKEGKVITDQGVEVRTDVSPMSENAPKQSTPIAKDELPETVIKIDVTAAGYTPTEFNVKAGEVVTIAWTSTDQCSHNITFEDSKLQSASTGVSAGTTRAITFNAPTEKGSYKFYCSIPGHAGRGEVGQMNVE